MLLTGMYIFHSPEGLLLLHAVVHFFHDPEGSLPSHTVRAFHPRSRRIVSVWHPCVSSMSPKGRFRLARSIHSFHFPEGLFPVRMWRTPFSTPKNRFQRTRCIFLSQFRRTASVLCGVHFFHVPEGSLPSCTPHISSTPPKGRFRYARPFFPSADPPKSTVSV